MLSKISWSQYITFFGIILSVYYLIITIKYYRKEILQFMDRLTGKKHAAPGIEAGSIKENSAR